MSHMGHSRRSASKTGDKAEIARGRICATSELMHPSIHRGALSDFDQLGSNCWSRSASSISPNHVLHSMNSSPDGLSVRPLNRDDASGEARRQQFHRHEALNCATKLGNNPTSGRPRSARRQ